MTIAELFSSLGGTGTWVDPLDGQTVYSDTAGTTQAVLDGPVARIDAPTGSPVAASFTNAASGGQPVLRADGMEFDGGDGLQYPDDPALRFGLTNFTIAFAIRPDALPSMQFVWDKRGGGSLGASPGWALATTGPSLRLLLDGAGFDAGPNNTVATDVFEVGVQQYGLIAIDRTANTATARIGGVDFSPTTIPAGDISGTQPLAIGDETSGSRGFTGTIRRLLVIDKLLSPEDTATVEAWLQGEPAVQSVQAPTAWRIKATVQRPSAWRVLGARSAGVAWRVLASVPRATAWRVLTARQQPTAWRVLARNGQAVSWRIKAGSARTAAWRVLARLARLTGWRIGDVLLPPPSVVIYATPRTRRLYADPRPRVIYARPPHA